MKTNNRRIDKRLKQTSHPLIYEVNARILVNELSNSKGRTITLANLPDGVIDEWSDAGFDAVWLMGVWTTGKAGLTIARTNADLRKEYGEVLPDYTDDDVIGSPYAVKSYTVSPRLGGDEGLQGLRRRLERKGLSLFLDFVCNHTARDHAWVSRHPEYYINGTAGKEYEKPDMFFGTKTAGGYRVLAYGRDPYFPGWTDTAQLNHLQPALRGKLVGVLNKIAKQCDGVRCDMAMLALKDVFVRTWSDKAVVAGLEAPVGEFWEEAIGATKAKHPGFLFIAEAYWDLEWDLQQLGFDYTYDKKLYDRLLREGAASVYDHLKADLEYQKRSVRFLENHDELRVSRLLPTEAWHYAAATVFASVPGMILFHDGQLEGRTVRVPVQLGRRPVEPAATQFKAFYKTLLSCLADEIFRTGEWRLVEAGPSWHENQSWRNFLGFWWKGRKSEARFVVVNYAPQSGQCYMKLDFGGIEGAEIEFKDLMGPATYIRDRSSLLDKGMFFDLPAYGTHFFKVSPLQHS